jgi:hypothetical protein
MLIEAKGQVPHGSWSRWLNKNFELSERTAQRHMRLARRYSDNDDDFKSAVHGGFGLQAAIGEKQGRSAWKSVHQAADRVNVTRLADERQKLADEAPRQLRSCAKMAGTLRVAISRYLPRIFNPQVFWDSICRGHWI